MTDDFRSLVATLENMANREAWRYDRVPTWDEGNEDFWRGYNWAAKEALSSISGGVTL
jgi:hypothetical protein